MKAATPMTIGLSLLIGVFVACTGMAVAMLALLKDPWIAVVAGVAALACVMAAAITYLVARSIEDQALALEPREPAPVEPAPLEFRAESRKPPSLPVAELPPAYLEAVMKGLRANREALRARSFH